MDLRIHLESQGTKKRGPPGVVPPCNRSAGPEEPGEGRREAAEKSVMTNASREGRECCQGSGKRGESPQLKTKSMEKGDCGGNQVPPGPGGMSG